MGKSVRHIRDREQSKTSCRIYRCIYYCSIHMSSTARASITAQFNTTCKRVRRRPLLCHFGHSDRWFSVRVGCRFVRMPTMKILVPVTVCSLNWPCGIATSMLNGFNRCIWTRINVVILCMHMQRHCET